MREHSRKTVCPWAKKITLTKAVTRDVACGSSMRRKARQWLKLEQMERMKEEGQNRRMISGPHRCRCYCAVAERQHSAVMVFGICSG